MTPDFLKFMDNPKRLTKHGAKGNYSMCCPFHEERTPSFTMNEEGGFYHCFGCGKHGYLSQLQHDIEKLVL